MGTVIPFPKAPCSPYRTATNTEVTEAQSAVARIMSECPACTGRGVIVFQCFDGEAGYAPCPCGGTDEDRIEIEDLRA